jgi:hypothetical protein
MEILEESRNMIPDAHARLEQAKQSLMEQIVLTPYTLDSNISRALAMPRLTSRSPPLQDGTESAEQAEAVKESDEWRVAREALGL